MINLLIVDDEKTTRDTLYHKIDWEGLGITSVAVARRPGCIGSLSGF